MKNHNGFYHLPCQECLSYKMQKCDVQYYVNAYKKRNPYKVVDVDLDKLLPIANGGSKVIYHKIIVEDVKLLATLKSVRRYMKDGCKYSLYCDCNNCKNRSFYDESYCNNEILHFIDSGKTTRVYCERFKV